ncbi:MAG: dTMP kinase [Alphaproteobacteria bacterium]
MSKRGLFLVFEGVDGSGTTTQVELLCDFLEGRGHKVIRTREPGGTRLSERIRHLVLDPNWKETSFLTELFLYAASRAQHVEELIKPAIEKGNIVVCDRFTASSVAYQSFGRGLSRDLVEKVNEIAIGSCAPDLTFFLRISMEEALRRRAHRAEQVDRLEEAGQRLQERVAMGYEAVFKEDLNTVIVDGHPSPEDIALEISDGLLKRWAWL